MTVKHIGEPKCGRQVRPCTGGRYSRFDCMCVITKAPKLSTPVSRIRVCL